MWSNASVGPGAGAPSGAVPPGPSLPPLPLPPLPLAPLPLSAAEGGARAARLLLVAGLAVVGSVGNVFIISSVITEDHLRRRGNAFLVSAALADLLVSGVAMPATAVAILAGQQEAVGLCRAQWLLALVALLVLAQAHAAMAAEGLARVAWSGRPGLYARRITKRRVAALALLGWATAATAAAAHFALRLPPQPCFQSASPVEGESVVAVTEAAVTGAGAGTAAAAAEAEAVTAWGAALLLGLPAVIALLAYVRAAVVARSALARPACKAAASLGGDLSLLRTNAWSALLLYCAWLPCGVALACWHARPFPSLPGLLFHLAWLALSRSCVNALLYCAANRRFRAAYVNLFHYCCCKTSVSFSRRARGGGGGGAGAAAGAVPAAGGGEAPGGGETAPGRPAGDVRVHIIPGYNMYSYTSPQRARDGPRGGGCGRTNGRDVYEL